MKVSDMKKKPLLCNILSAILVIAFVIKSVADYMRYTSFAS